MDESGRIQGRGEIISFVITGTPGFVLAEKLKLLKAKMKEWSKNNRNNCKAQRRRLWRS